MKEFRGSEWYGECAMLTAVLAILGTLFGQRLLRKHFQKAGIVG